MSILSRIADQLKRDAIKKFERADAQDVLNGYTVVEHPLKGGAILRMVATHNQFALLIMRVDVLPGDVEMKTFRAVFGIPPEIKAVSGRDTRRRLHFYHLVWDRPAPVTQTPLDLEKVTASN